LNTKRNASEEVVLHLVTTK